MSMIAANRVTTPDVPYSHLMKSSDTSTDIVLLLPYEIWCISFCKRGIKTNVPP